MANYHHPDEDFYRKLDVPLPKFQTHGTEEEMRANLVRLKTENWRLEGNELVCMTEMGELRQTIPTDYILTGTDSAGLPILKKLLL